MVGISIFTANSMWSSYLLNYKWNLEHYLLKDEELM